MNILILNGGPQGERGALPRKIRESIEEELRGRGHAVSAFDLAGMTVKPCLGCFDCWLKHPGLCALKDDQEAVTRGQAQNDVSFWITPITFGGYAPALKKSLDRSISVALPFFIRHHGEIHHPSRYPKDRKLAVIGTRPAPDPDAERIFEDLVRRNALNLKIEDPRTTVIHENADAAEIPGRIRELLRAVEVL
ncbi:MAG: NAD(P)H-dependent oxidoreductase [Candidatus Aminicenantales bacterium]